MSTRTVVRVATAAAAATSLLLAAASPAGAATTTERYSTQGVGASVFSSTAPADGQLLPGVTYTDTFLDAGEQATRANGQQLVSSFAFVDRFSYRVTRSGRFEVVSSVSGFAGPESVTFTGDRKLAGASVTGSIPTVSCTETACTESAPIAVDVTWTGTGAVARVSGRFSYKDGTTSFSSTSRGTQRQASVTGSIGGVPLGDVLFAGLTSGTSTDKFLCHRC